MNLTARKVMLMAANRWANQRLLRPGVSYAPALTLPPEDRLPEEPIDSDRCHECPARAVALLFRMVTYRHLDWSTYEAASVRHRRACGHHLVELEGAGWEVALNPRLS
jgi:hypothetical protein